MKPLPASTAAKTSFFLGGLATHGSSLVRGKRPTKQPQFDSTDSLCLLCVSGDSLFLRSSARPRLPPPRQPPPAIRDLRQASASRQARAFILGFPRLPNLQSEIRNPQSSPGPFPHNALSSHPLIPQVVMPNSSGEKRPTKAHFFAPSIFSPDGLRPLSAFSAISAVSLKIKSTSCHIQPALVRLRRNSCQQGDGTQHPGLLASAERRA
jgi:hypothetical protein